MAGARRNHRGGIVSLWELHDELPEAVEYELIRLGLRWRQVGTEVLSWRDLAVIVAQASPDGPLFQAKYPEEIPQIRLERLLELVHYELSVANTQRGNQSGAKRSDFPDVPEWAKQKDTETYGSEPVPFDDMAAFLGGDFLTLLP